MACFHPITGYRTPEGKVTFDRQIGYVDRPVTVACGRCRGCRLEKSRQWAVRCWHEAATHERNTFVTLTYDNAHLPENQSIDVAHWQKFARRIRKKKGPFRFFHCGEYGDLWGRPHYHAIMFGMDFQGDRVPWKMKNDQQLWVSQELEELWGLGRTVIGEVTFKSAAYVARYIMKKITGEVAEAHYTWVDEQTGEEHTRKPEYTTMSRRPGIAKEWIDKYGKEVYNADSVIVNGREARPPKYYDGQYELIDKDQMDSVKLKRRRKAQERAWDNTPERLRVREKVTEAKQRSWGRGKTEEI